MILKVVNLLLSVLKCAEEHVIQALFSYDDLALEDHCISGVGAVILNRVSMLMSYTCHCTGRA